MPLAYADNEHVDANDDDDDCVVLGAASVVG